MSQYPPSFGRSPLPSPRPSLTAAAPIAEPEPDFSEDHGGATPAERSHSNGQSLTEEVEEVLSDPQNGNDVHHALPCNASPSIPIRPLSAPPPVPKSHLGIALFIAWAVTSDGFSNLGGLPDVCSSKECIDTAFRIANSIDGTVDPCENFYRYSCGKFHRQDVDKQLNFLERQTDTTRRKLYGAL
ncbi:unnamed protein product [Heligmosomoides polygyrus]|uniref:Neprilysin n=1 Tax=Heligmosomoides polygyrus TaxID=6339 RepID=A0A3P7WY27_HELPZ|nr:unnamed protein product [Heligmosomoides polygyrus]